MPEERNAQNSNEDGEELALGDAVPYGGIRLLEALADDAGCSVQERKQGREEACRCFFPE